MMGALTAIQHAALVLDVPDAWEDRSTLLFVAPPPPSTDYADTRPKAGKALAVRFAAAAGRDASACLQEQFAAAHASDPKAKILRELTFACGLGEGRLMEQEIHLLGRAMFQCAVCVVVDSIAVLASASCSLDAPDTERAALTQMLSSLRKAG